MTDYSVFRTVRWSVEERYDAGQSYFFKLLHPYQVLVPLQRYFPHVSNGHRTEKETLFDYGLNSTAKLLLTVVVIDRILYLPPLAQVHV